MHSIEPVGRLPVGLQVPLHLEPDGDVHLHEPQEEVHLQVGVGVDVRRDVGQGVDDGARALLVLGLPLGWKER